METKDIVDYVMKTPGNTNGRILSQMVNEVAGSGGRGEGFTGYKGVEFTSPGQEFEVDLNNLDQYPSIDLSTGLTLYKVSDIPIYKY